MKCTIEKLKTLTDNALKNQGYSQEESSVISEVLLYAQLRGNNQGVVKLIGNGMPKNQDAGEITVKKETPLSINLDGNHNHAMVVVSHALKHVINKAGQNGFAISATHNTSTSSGAIGYYASEIAKAGFIGFVFSRAPERVATFGSYEPVFGTNPVAVAFPVKTDPVVLDMSTAAMSFYGLLEAKTAGQSIPDTVAYDADGHSTTDPAAAIGGALRSFDGSYKGSGLALMVEALAGPLAGAAFSGRQDSKSNWGHLLFAIDPDLLGDKDEFISNMEQLVSHVKGTKKLPGVSEIFMPGERGAMAMKQSLETGEIEIEGKLMEELKKAAAESHK